MNSPLVTVVIPTIKPRKGFLRRAVNSVMAQTYGVPPIEIAIDREHEGAAATRNRALMNVRTPWVAFLDDDDYFLPNHLEVLLREVKATNIDVIYPGCRVIGPDFETIPMQEEWGRFGQAFDPTALRNQSCIPVTSMVRTELAQHAMFGPPDHDPKSWYDDWGFYLRLLDLKAQFHHVPEVTWIWHHHGRNTSGQGDRW